MLPPRPLSAVFASRLLCVPCRAGPVDAADLAWQLQQQLATATPAASAASAAAAAQPLFDTAEGLETPIQLLYLTALLGFLAAGAYLVVRQVLIRRELDEAAKALGERIRTGEATCEVCARLGGEGWGGAA